MFQVIFEQEKDDSEEFNENFWLQEKETMIFIKGCLNQ
jgi:hypothetical protein